MESFLSLPRSAKTGLAVLLAVALLGWGIVAYSSKRQHEGSRSLQQALVTLDQNAEAEQAASAELDQFRQQLTTAENELSATMQDKAELQDQINGLQSDLSKRENVVAELTEQLERLQASTNTAEGNERTLGLSGAEGANVDIATLRERLTKARTALSARNATLAQRDRELEKTIADHEAAIDKIATLEAELLEQGVLRDRLTTTMTTLSSRTATLGQRDRELERLKTDYEAANKKIADLEANLAEQGVLRQRLKAQMTKLSGVSATLAQRDRTLSGLSEQNLEMQDKLAAFEADAAEQEASDQNLSSIDLRLDRSNQELKKTEDALSVNRRKINESEARLAELQDELTKADSALKSKGDELAAQEARLQEMGQKISAEEKKLADLLSTSVQRKNEIETAEETLAELKEAKAEIEADINSLQAELDEKQGALSQKEDALADVETRLSTLENEVLAKEKQIADLESRIQTKSKQLGDRQLEVDNVEATLAALKEDQSKSETGLAGLKTSIDEQEAVLADLEAIKADLEDTETELNYQQQILAERQEQIRLEDARLEQLKRAVRDASSGSKAADMIPIAALSSDNVAVLPIDPLYEPFPIQTPIGIRLTQIHFDLGSDKLTPGGLRKAKEAAAWIKAQDVETVRLVGFTDSIGTREDNLVLAERRAESMLRLFEKEGIDPDRIEIIAKGEAGTREVIDDQTSEPLNRCVGVFIGANG